MVNTGIKIINYKIEIDEDLYNKIEEYLSVNKITIRDFIKLAVLNESERLNLPDSNKMRNEEIQKVDMDELKEKILRRFGSLNSFAKFANMSQAALSRGFSKKDNYKFKDILISRMVKAVA